MTRINSPGFLLYVEEAKYWLQQEYPDWNDKYIMEELINRWNTIYSDRQETYKEYANRDPEDSYYGIYYYGPPREPNWIVIGNA